MRTSLQPLDRLKRVFVTRRSGGSPKRHCKASFGSANVRTRATPRPDRIERMILTTPIASSTSATSTSSRARRRSNWTLREDNSPSTFSSWMRTW